VSFLQVLLPPLGYQRWLAQCPALLLVIAP
jgi:hypothetical protein